MRFIRTWVKVGALGGVAALLLTSACTRPNPSIGNASTTETPAATVAVPENLKTNHADEANSPCGLGGQNCDGPINFEHLDPLAGGVLMGPVPEVLPGMMTPKIKPMETHLEAIDPDPSDGVLIDAPVVEQVQADS